MTGERDYWTATEVARHRGVALGTISSYLARGQMPEPDARFGRTPVWRPATILEWEANLKREPPPRPSTPG